MAVKLEKSLLWYHWRFSVLWMIRVDLGIESQPEGRRWRGMWHSQLKELPQQAIVIFKEANLEKWQVCLFSLSDNGAEDLAFIRK